MVTMKSRVRRAGIFLGASLFRASILAASLVSFITLNACTDELRPGFCEANADCPSGQRCELGPSASFHRCVAVDSATPDGGIDRPAQDGARPGDGADAPAATCSPATAATDCTDPGRPFCQGGICVGCQAPDAGTCPAGRSTCDPTSGACVECVSHDQCRSPGQPICNNRQCASCMAAGGDSGCQARDPQRPLCLASSGQCVECTGPAQCAGKPGRGFCAMNACVGCQSAGATACTGATPVCNATTGVCAECVADADCKQATAPFCSNNKCVPCGMEPAARCAATNPALPACAPSGACVACTTSANCTDASRPICNTANNTCRACAADAECVARNGAEPGVCLDHLGGRCATEAEVIVVAKTATCGTTGGSKAMPLCSAQDAPKLFAANRSVVLIRGTIGGFSWGLAGVPLLTVVGQQQAVVAGGLEAGVRLAGGGEVVARGLTIRGSEGGGVVATAGATLRLRDTIIDSNAGGGLLLDGARFDVRNTVISNNGPATIGATLWGGALVANVPGTPARFERVSVKGNRVVGITCGAGTTISSTGVFAKDNVGIDVSPSCTGFMTCEPEGPACGAPPAP
ncbi:MAG TPA: right-handed parallel beta-helix repeat-containing protein [Polyangia bacterium]